MKTKLWHATAYDNLASIVENGIFCGCEGLVYACETAEDAAKFVAIRGIKTILCAQFEVDENDVHESFDHAQAFFKCKAYYVQHNIKSESLVDFRKFELS